MSKSYQLACQCSLLGIFLASNLGGSSLFASQQFDELKAIDQSHLSEIDKFKSEAQSEHQKSAEKNLMTDYSWIGVCDPAPIPTVRRQLT
ncbi:hypothetical protein ACFL07_01325 [Pseudomonadota bacterium]